ncbi:MAG: sulfatase-like hydrolase/transferase, partial [Phycisphaeraceae bacterium]|nr:sulfatase-like hydrolase/transferase [Phycisphaeraceae bacterium]
MSTDVNRKPNIVIFNPDQYRGDVLAHMGNPAAVTPNLDRFATEDGVSFRNAFCQSPICTASRCSFMSGWYPHTRGHPTMLHMMHKDEPVLLKTLKDNGYYVWWGGKNDLVPAQDGFDDYCTVKYEPAESPGAKHTIDTMDRRRGSMDSDTYYSFFVGKLDHTPGYDRNADDDWALVDGALEMIRNYKGDKPFCLYLPLSYPHPPYAIDEPWFS